MSGPCEWVFDHLALPAPPGSVLQILNVRVIVVEVTRGQTKSAQNQKKKGEPSVEHPFDLIIRRIEFVYEHA